MDSDQLLALHRTGISSRQIAADMGLHHSTVGRYLSSLGLKGNRDPRKKLQMLPDGRAQCTKCFQSKELSEFRVQRSNAKYPYRLSYCDSCRRKQTQASTRRSLEAYLSNRLARLQIRAAKQGVDFDLTVQSILDRFAQQEGKCFYTDAPLSFEQTEDKRTALSFDRVFHCGGYTQSNVVLCTVRANTIKNDLTMEELQAWMPSWFARVQAWKAF